MTHCALDHVVQRLSGTSDSGAAHAMQQQQQQLRTWLLTVTPPAVTAQAHVMLQPQPGLWKHAGACREEVRKVQQGLPWPGSGSGSKNGEANENGDAGPSRVGGSENGRRFVVDEFEQAAMSPEGAAPGPGHYNQACAPSWAGGVLTKLVAFVDTCASLRDWDQ